MIKQLVVFLGALAFAPVAQAGVGVTGYGGALSDGTFWAPSVDIRSSGWLVQIHALDLIGNLPADAIITGVDVSKVTLKRDIAPEVEGVVMPGAGFGLFTTTDFDPMLFNFTVFSRWGMEMKKGAGFGVYVTPEIGASNRVTGDVGLVYGGGLEVSVWLK